MNARRNKRMRLLNPSQSSNSRRDVMEAMFSHGFPYSRKLSAHTSCVNHLAFSSQGGRFLASGGDDRDVHLWDFHQEQMDGPSHTFVGPRSNIFTLAFSATNRYLFSGGTDFSVYQYDITRLESSPSRMGSSQIFHQKDCTRSITCHPHQDELFLTASDDGRIIRYDLRESSNHITSRVRAQDVIQLEAEVTGIQHHPQMDQIFVSSSSNGDVCLRDARMAFGPSVTRTRGGVVQQYNTKLGRGNVFSHPEPSSVAFDRDGDKLAITLLHYLPTIFALSESQPLAVCSGRNFPDGRPHLTGERTYSNSCTMKHGSFGGPGLEIDEFFSSGSDDFRGYIWRIPPLADLREHRETVSAEDWALEAPGRIAFAEGLNEPRYVPVELSTPVCHLNGHQSIVNTTLIHPSFPFILTSGIERDILLHSATESAPFADDLSLSPTIVRRLGDAASDDEARVVLDMLSGYDRSVSSDVEEAERDTILMFDRIIRQEGQSDIFEVRPWSPVESEPDELESNEEEEEC